MALNDSVLMSSPNHFKAINDLMALVKAAQGLSGCVMASNMGDALSMMLTEKVREIENILATFGPQRLASLGVNTGGGMPQMNPFTTAPVMNQNFHYPTMGQQSGYVQPQHFAQPQPMAPQPQMQPMPVQQAPPQMAPAPAPVAPPQMAPQPQAEPVAVAPAPQPAPVAAESPATSAPSNGGGGGNVFMALPGALGGGGGDDKPAVGRDYLLKILSG